MSKRTVVGGHGNALVRLFAALVLMTTAAVAPGSDAADGRSSAASHIPATGTGAAPLAVLERADIELSGLTNLWDLLQGRVGFNSFGLFRPFALGSSRVAILVNGRRVSDSTFDLRTVPISAVERIEILGDSAAALHGGNAIAGAVNIVLARGHEGADFRASAYLPSGDGGDTTHGSALWGSALGGGHLVAGVDVLRRQEIRRADRDHSRASWTAGGSFADSVGVSAGGNTLFIPSGEGASIARPLGDCRGSAYTGVLTRPYGVPGAGCGFAWADVAWAEIGSIPVSRYERGSAFVNFDQPLAEDTDLYLDARVAQGDTAFRYAPSVGEFEFNPSQALRETLLDDPDIDAVPETISVVHRFVGHGNRDWLTDLEEYDLTVGLKGRFGKGLGYDAHVRYYRHDTLETGNTFVSESAVQQAIDAGHYDLENPLSSDPVHRAAIRETGLELKREEVTEHRTLRASVNGAAFSVPGGAVRWAGGAEAAHEDRREVYDYRDVADASYDPVDVLGSAGNSFSGRRRRWSLFTEVSVPLSADWELVLAGRRDDHDDVGETFSHQVASRFRLNEALALRGSWSGGSRTPSLYAMHLQDALDYPRVCDTKTHTGPLEDCHRFQPERVSGGNPRLRPDDAESLTFGAVVSLGPFSVSADWFRLRLSDTPARLSAQSVIDLEVEGRLPPGAEVVRRGGLIEQIRSPLINSGETDVDGIDLRAGAEWKTDWADVAFAAYWSTLTRAETRVAGEVQPGDYPRNRFHARLSAGRNGFTASWSVLGKSSYWNTLRSGRYESWTGHDITLRWRDPFGWDGVDLTGGILNVGDRGPSSANPGDEDETLDSVTGRTFFVSAKVSF